MIVKPEIQQVDDAFQSKYGEKPLYIVAAPGRVNLIGEHTDYNDGFVLPMAINHAIFIALRPREDRRVIVQALDFDWEIQFSLDNLQKEATSPAEYIKGMAWALQQAGYALSGWEGTMKGDIPIGAGLSSSAALEMATARAFGVIAGEAWNAPKMAKLGQKTENEWIGVNSGIMDQMISAAGIKDHALLIDCRSLETTPSPLPPGTVVVILDTATRRGLVDSAYNERRAQCEAAARYFGVPALRDVSIEDFDAKADGLDALTRRRAKHVITENQRTLQASEAMQTGDAQLLGHLMNQSHISMRDDFEISGDALNAIVECAQAHAACYGARMTGGGFAGCAVALVQEEAAEDFKAFVSKCYSEKLRLTPNIYITPTSGGAWIVRA